MTAPSRPPIGTSQPELLTSRPSLPPAPAPSAALSTGSIHPGAQAQTLKVLLNSSFPHPHPVHLASDHHGPHHLSPDYCCGSLLLPVPLPQSIFSTGAREPLEQKSNLVTPLLKNLQRLTLFIVLQPHQSVPLGPLHVQIPLPIGLHPQWPCDLLFHLLQRFAHRPP